MILKRVKNVRPGWVIFINRIEFAVSSCSRQNHAVQEASSIVMCIVFEVW